MREALVRVRQQSGKTQKEVATLAGISRSFYAHIEAGTRSCSLQVALRIARALAVTVEDIFAPDNVSPKHNRGALDL